MDRLAWLENEVKRTAALCEEANKATNEVFKVVLELSAANRPISTKLRVLCDFENQYRILEWRSKYEDDSISTFDDFSMCPERHFEYAAYCIKLRAETSTEFIKNGGGYTFDEFDIKRCREISKA